MGVIDSLDFLMFSLCVESNTLFIRTCLPLCYSFILGWFPPLEIVLPFLRPPSNIPKPGFPHLHSYGKNIMKFTVYETTKVNILIPDLSRD